MLRFIIKLEKPHFEQFGGFFGLETLEQDISQKIWLHHLLS